jgi:lysyl-tRNA synthetase class 1
VLFETGYGPSGLPHIGTFGEVARTTMVRNAFKALSDIPTKLYSFSDDMDGLRKVPENIPNQDMVREHLGKPLTSVPDPFGTHESYGHHMNAKLRSFLDAFGFDYEFKSATECYKSGMFDATLLKALKHYDEIMNIMLPTLGEERQATYSPFLPICPKTGIVLMVPIVARDESAGTITYKDDNGKFVEVPVTGGHCKMQWKPDLGMRWAALDVDFEMYGKDHLPNGPIYSKICEIIGGKVPHQYFYELFLDEKGQKISKSKGNGITIDEWLTYAPTESLALYMYQSPRKAKKLYFDVIPRQVDDYLTYVNKYQQEDEAKRYANPVWHIHNGNPPSKSLSEISFNLLLNLACACNPEDKSVLWGFISKYSPNSTPENSPFLDRLADYAVRYYNDFVKPTKNYRSPNEAEAVALKELIKALKELPQAATDEEIQNAVYAIGKNNNFELKDFFKAMYEILLGQTQGPRLGSFIKLYGVEPSIQLIEEALKR